MKKLNQLAQNTIEYMLITATVIVIVLAAVGPRGFLTKSVNQSLEFSANSIDCMAERVCYPGDPSGCPQTACSNAGGGSDDGNDDGQDPGNCEGVDPVNGEWQSNRSEGVCKGAPCEEIGTQTIIYLWQCVAPICGGDPCGTKPPEILPTTDSCTMNACGTSVCGNELQEDGEGCDDGNLTDGDGCSATCSLSAIILCGNGLPNPGEECDDGNANSDDGCSPACLLESSLCGNGEPDSGEECDDGNNESLDGCSASCQNESCEAPCGAGELCQNGICRCGADCNFDGIVTQDELLIIIDIFQNRGGSCPGADTNGRDGLSASEVQQAQLCGNAHYCGNGFKEYSEECDDGNSTAGDGCLASCKTEAAAVCGDGVIGPGEGCDDSNTTSNDGCSSSCQTEAAAVCGDGVVGLGEGCDDSNTAAGDGCSATCRIEVVACGDGVVSSGEGCDDSNTTSNDGCSSTCQLEQCEAVTNFSLGGCGSVNVPVLNSGASKNGACPANCVPSFNIACQGTMLNLTQGCSLPPPSRCGNGIQEPGENCENCNADSAGIGCCNDGACTFKDRRCAGSGECNAAQCGNGTCDAGESCLSCPGDCPVCCGDGECTALAINEDCQSCPSDCGTCLSSCGNGNCDRSLGERKYNCRQDCFPKCGDGNCKDETTRNCVVDCGGFVGNCGNRICEPYEDNDACPEDCPT